MGYYLLVCDEMDYLKLLVGTGIRAVGLYSVVVQICNLKARIPSPIGTSYVFFIHSSRFS